MLEIKSNKKTFFSGFSTYFKTILTGKELRVARLTGSQLRECRELYQADKTVLVTTQYFGQKAQFYDPENMSQLFLKVWQNAVPGPLVPVRVKN